MAVTTQVALASAAVFAAGRETDATVREQFLGRLQGLEADQAGRISVFTNGRLQQLAQGLDAPSRLCREWLDAELGGLHERCLPAQVGWRLERAPLLETVDLRGTSLSERILAQLTEFAVPNSDPLACRHAVTELLPASASATLEQFGQGFSPSPGLLLRGLSPVKALPGIILGVAASVGQPFTEDNESSVLVQHIRPRPELAFSQTSASSEAPLLEHVENVGTPNVPDWLAIGCMRNLEMAETSVLHPVEAMYSMVRAGLLVDVARLFENKYWVRNPESFGGERTKLQGMRVLSGPSENPSVQADFADMGSDSPEHARAFEAFREHCGIVREMVCLEPGDVLLLRNTGHQSAYLHQQSMHGRGSFRAHPVPGQERYLLRVFIRENSISAEA